MRTLLVIAPDVGLASALRAAVDHGRYRVLQHPDFQEDELLLTSGAADACFLDVDLTNVEPIRLIERVRQAMPGIAIFLYASDSDWAWEEDAYLRGVAHVLHKPVRARLLNALLDRLFPDSAALVPSTSLALAPQSAGLPARIEPARAVVEVAPLPMRTLQLLRNYSSILTHSLCAESLLREFLLMLREIVGVNRAAIFLRATGPDAARRLRCASSQGLDHILLQQFDLTLDSGVGGRLFRTGRMLRRDGPDADQQARREFELLGAEVAIPVLDRESLVGVAVFDGRVTGDSLDNDELLVIFHLLEQLGMALKNIRLHDQVSADHEMMSGILGQLKSGCLVVAQDLTILHANDIARRCFGRPTGRFAFHDLPQAIGSRLLEALTNVRPSLEFKYAYNNQRFQIAITPFRHGDASGPNAVLMLIEDCGPAERLRDLEVETANLRLVRQMAERLAHEIGNAIVPISTHHQLLKERAGDPEFQASLGDALDDAIKRVTRLVDQMRFLALDRLGKTEPVPVRQLIEEAFREARSVHPAATVLLQYEASDELTLQCDRQGLQHAFAEIILNALQANINSCQVQVRTRSEIDASGAHWAQIEVQDSGQGFSAESAGKAQQPFYTTRNVGLGLGLAVTNKIIQTHLGRLEIPLPRAGAPGLVRVSLPINPEAMPPPPQN